MEKDDAGKIEYLFDIKIASVVMSLFLRLKPNKSSQ